MKAASTPGSMVTKHLLVSGTTMALQHTRQGHTGSMVVTLVLVSVNAAVWLHVPADSHPSFRLRKGEA